MDSLKFEQDAAQQLTKLLDQVPSLEFKREHFQGPDQGVDFLFTVNFRGHSYKLLCEVKNYAQPRMVREAGLKLRYACERFIDKNTYGVLIAPYLSEASQRICKELGIGFADMEGNCLLSFNGVHIDRLVASKPSGESRRLKSLFAPKSAQILRILLREPYKPWKVVDLAEAASVSLGHVSNIRKALFDREWGKPEHEGFRLTEPDRLLDTWREVYRRPGKRFTFYTTLHGKALQSQVVHLIRNTPDQGEIMLASFSAAQFIAPYARNPTEFFYADRKGLDLLRSELRLSSAAKGENVTVWEVEDKGFFHNAMEPEPGLRCTGPIQTYLDLSASGDRGREAAEFLRERKLKWHT